jgi:DNA-directed RNA polymerase sigma subunit (sigma70/sigma32)
MLQEGRMLVYEAAKKFQIERGHKFTTYLSFHLHKLNGIANEFGVIRVPRPQGHGVSAAEDRKRDFRRKLMSIDAPRDDHDEGLVRILPAPTPYDHGFDEEKLPEWLHKLTIRERLVVMSRAEGFTLGDTGKLLGLTKERIRQIETAAIEHLRVMAGIANAKEEKRVLGRIQYRETMQRAAERRQVASMESAAI